MVKKKIERNIENRFLKWKVLIISLIALPIAIFVISVIISVLKNDSNEYVLYNDDSFSIHCYLNKTINGDNDWNVVKKVDIGDKITCNVSYEIAENISKLSYELEYGNALRKEKVDTYWGNVNDIDANLDIKGNLFTYTYTNGISFDDSPNIIFEVTNNNTNDLYVAIKNIKILTTNGEKYYENNSYYLLEGNSDEIINRIDYGNELEVATIVYTMKNHILPTFNNLDELVDKKYQCEERKINSNGTIYLKNCDNGSQIVTHGKDYSGYVGSDSIYTYKDNDMLFISKERNNNYSLIDIYNCESSLCNGLIEDDMIYISDFELKYKKIGSNKNYKLVHPIKSYEIKQIDGNKNIFIRYYDINGKKLYSYFEYYDDKIDDKQYIKLEGNNSVIIQFDENNELSFNNSTLESGYLLINKMYEDENKNYIYDYKNKNIVFDLSSYDEFKNSSLFMKIENNFAVVSNDSSYQEILYLNPNMKVLYDETISMDDNYYIFKNKNILFKRDNKFYIYDQNGIFIKNAFSEVSPISIEVDENDKIYGIVKNKDSNGFNIYDDDNNLVHTSKTYDKIYDVYKAFGKIFVIVDEKGFLKLYDKNEKLMAIYTKMTDNLEYDYNYYGDVWIRDNNIKIGQKGAYILFYYDALKDTLNVYQKSEEGDYEKPVLYLYPKEKEEITVKFEHHNLLSTTYPKYYNEWKVIAYPNGDLYDNDNKYYYGLYWEENNKFNADFKEGFYVTKNEAISFLEEKLSIIGLNPRERNEFIMYWLPVLEKNEKSLVYFELTEEREKGNKLLIEPQPDSMLRMAIHIKRVNQKTNIKEQKLERFNRYGFSVVEWGGKRY